MIYCYVNSGKQNPNLICLLIRTNVDEVNSLLNESKQAYYRDLLNDTSNNLDSFWSTIKKLYPNKPTKLSSPMFKIDSVNTSEPSILNAFSTILSTLKEKAFLLRDCIWTFQEEQSLRTDCRFKFENVNVLLVCKQLKSLK